MSTTYPHKLSLAKIAVVLIGLHCLFAANIALSMQSDVSEAAEREMLSNYETAMAKGDQAAAVKYALDYSEKLYGEDAPKTINLTHRYGSMLYQAGKFREATDVLIIALERSTVTFGESGGEAFELNMNIAYAYSKWRPGLSPRTRYFDRALEILRERGEHESIIYVTTLTSIAINLMENGGLGGGYTSHLSDTLQSPQVDAYVLPIESEYYSNYSRAEGYILEAAELSKKLEDQDEYITSKVAIAHAKLKVMETANLGVVPMGVTGYISKGTEREYYDREEERLTDAIDDLSRDTETNSIFLNAANSVLLDIAWMDGDENRMMAMCSNGTLNSADKYPPERLYDVMEGGMVFAPEIGIRVSKNIFRPLRSRNKQKEDKNGERVKKPYFIPVCVDGRLMAALIHAPKVTVEEIR